MKKLVKLENQSLDDRKILIVDDDDFLLEMYAIKFRQSGFHVEVAQNGKKALEQIPVYEPDIILLDVVMPSIDGFEVLSEIKNKKMVPHATIIMLTNLGQKDDTERGLRLGADAYVIKAHFTPTEVVEKVKKMINKK